MQRKRISFEGQNIYIGIDVHRKNWQIAILTESGHTKGISIHSSAKELFDFLNKNYQGGVYHAVYESGFSGFATYYALKEYDIDCTVIHAADVPTTQYEEVMKSDRIDALKLARALKGGLLTSVYIRDKANLDDRSVIRIRKTIQKQLAGYKVRIKHMLHCNGVSYPKQFESSGSHWSGAFIKWLKEDVKLLSPTRRSLDLLLLQVETIRRVLLEATLQMRLLSKEDRYKEKYNLLMSVPGIGPKVAMCLLVEVWDINRFRNERQFASYLGLIPTCHSSGEKTAHGEITFRGNKQIGPMLIETCWVAIRKDIGLNAAYNSYKKRMTGPEAIVRIARKVSNIIFAVLKTGTPYVPYQWNE